MSLLEQSKEVAATHKVHDEEKVVHVLERVVERDNERVRLPHAAGGRVGAAGKRVGGRAEVWGRCDRVGPADSAGEHGRGPAWVAGAGRGSTLADISCSTCFSVIAWSAGAAASPESFRGSHGLQEGSPAPSSGVPA